MFGEITLAPREVKLTTRTNTLVRRTLPHRELKTIGAWCFLDHYGPTDSVDAMSIAQHPHVGLQTVSWLFSGEIEHRDSVGSIQNIKPGQLNLMTSGFGIAHSELSLAIGKQLHGVQLWIALPATVKDVAPHFEHHHDLPEFDLNGINAKLLIGHWQGFTSPAKAYSPLLGVELTGGPGSFTLPLNPSFEHGVLVDQGSVVINKSEVETNNLHYLPTGQSQMQLESKTPFRLMLLGGEPFEEEFIMWWNFIGRSHEEIVKMREDWQNHGERFAQFEDRIGGRIPAPEMPNLKLKSRNSRH